jgi:predicted Zn-dependent protease
MTYSKDEVRKITDKVLNMCKADAVEVRFSGGERSATRFANSSITANLIENDQEVQITVSYGQKSASATTHQFDDESLKRTIDSVQALARRKPDNPELMPLVKPPQQYIEVDAALPSAVNFGPAERARMVKASTEICEKKGVLGAGTSSSLGERKPTRGTVPISLRRCSFI